MNKLIRQFIKFGIVGGANTLVDLAVLTLLITAFNTGRQGAIYALFKAVAFGAAVANSYFFNKHWTFKGESNEAKGKVMEVSEFAAVSIVGLIINVGVATVIATFVEPVYGLGQYWPQIGALGGTAVGLFWNFLGYKLFVFNKQSRNVRET